MPNKACKFRLYPTPAQKILLAKTFGCVRLVYNHWLDRKISQYKEDQTALSYTSCAKELTVLKKTDQYDFLKEVDSISLQQSLRHLDQAFQNFFKRPGTGFPRFKSKRNRKNSYSTVCVNQNILLSDGCLKLPKIGPVKVKQHRKIPASYVLKSVTVSQSPSGKYHASILFEYENQVPERKPHTFLGLDFSMNGLYKDSEGNEAKYPKYHRQAEKKLKREQRKLSHMQKGSRNWEKQRIKVARLHEKVANQRKDFLHKRSREIVNAYDCVCIEDLDMKAMARSLHFGKSVHDNGWGMFTTFLKYKLEDQGKQLIRIDKWYPSSQTCSVCGYKNPETKDLGMREWDCPNCKSHHDRDLNAAINIRNEGMRLISA
ncbi:IS200/IS605 family element RNA-guided endonuclease TnpB [uncultured Dubosiella sp.]|uniref:IS200/IS605 family element RNA-guided endonuclease TnpB n=3 Tax=uncultured Dubosiella sp. TaxID=1937011 RepID=UPI00263B71D8|nr:IS200/IS605 family element RNA-guided endonuclease TnpB [uncultured Dubosiella sp.]